MHFYVSLFENSQTVEAKRYDTVVGRILRNALLTAFLAGGENSVRLCVSLTLVFPCACASLVPGAESVHFHVGFWASA